MAGRLLMLGALRGARSPLGVARMSMRARDLIGNRDLVGFGYNGQPNYVDRSDFPFPAVRWKENTPDIKALREKEKGDWRKLSIDEKKELYRASFCQTFSEFQAPTGDWKVVVGGVFMVFTAAILYTYVISNIIYFPLPITYSEEYRRIQLRRILDLQMNPIEGISTLWDYDKDDWKSK